MNTKEKNRFFGRELSQVFCNLLNYWLPVDNSYVRKFHDLSDGSIARLSSVASITVQIMTPTSRGPGLSPPAKLSKTAIRADIKPLASVV